MANEDLIKALRECADPNHYCAGCKYDKNGSHCVYLLRDAADAIEAADKRIAELMPKEGEWETTDNRWGCGKYRCTVCNSYENDKRNYCPNCGARMNGKEKDDE